MHHALLLAALVAGTASAQTPGYPAKPVKVVVGFAAGGPSDIVARAYVDPLARASGQTVIVATGQVRRLTGTNMVHVPHEGAAPAVSDLIGSQVDLSFATVGSVLPHLRLGKLMALAVASRQGSALLPDVPTFEEAGVKGFVIDTWYGVLAPAGTPVDALRVPTREATEFSRSAATRERLAAAGLEPGGVGGDPFSAQLVREIEANTRLARDLNLKVE